MSLWGPERFFSVIGHASAGDKVSFFWKVSSESGDYLEFYIDGSLKASIDGEKDWQKKSYSLSAGSRTLKWVYEKDSDTSEGDDAGWVDGLYVGPASGSLPPDPEGPGAYAEAVDSSLKFTSSGDSTWWTSSGWPETYYYDADSAKSYDALGYDEESILQTIVDSAGSETLKFYWKVSSNENDDYLEFYIDGTRQDRISGEVDWTQKEYAISAGIHTLKWRYIRYSGAKTRGQVYLLALFSFLQYFRRPFGRSSSSLPGASQGGVAGPLANKFRTGTCPRVNVPDGRLVT